MNDAHCSDELLISFLDGEISAADKRQIAAHLDRCWNCRARCHEMEEAITAVSRLVGDADSAVGDSVERVRTPLFAAMDREPAGNVLLRSVRPIFFFAAALAAAAAVGRWVVLMPHAPAPPVVQARNTPRAVPAAPQPITPPVAAEAVPMPKPPEIAAVLPPPPMPAIDLDEVELALRFQLHQTGADLRYSAIRIAQDAGLVTVDGVVDDPVQASELQQTAARIEHPELVAVNVRLASDAGPITATPYQAETVARPEQPFLQTLISLAGSERDLTQKGNQAVATVEQMTDTAWALRHLMERFQPRQLLSENSHRWLESIQNDYRARLARSAAVLRDQLAFLPASPAAACDTADPPAQVFALRDLVEWLFAGKPLRVRPRSLEETAQIIATQVNCLAGSYQPDQGE